MKLRLLLVAASLCAGCAAQPATTPGTEAPASGTIVPIIEVARGRSNTSRKARCCWTTCARRSTAGVRRGAEARSRFRPRARLSRTGHARRRWSRRARRRRPLQPGRCQRPNAPLVQGLDAERRGDFTAAEATYARVAELAPGDWRGHYAHGRLLLGEQRYDEAVEHLKKATSVNRKPAVRRT